MVDDATLDQLSADEYNEYQQHKNRFIQEMLHSDVESGTDFQNSYRVYSDGSTYFLASSRDAEPFAGIRCKHRAAIETLLTDAVQNYGR